VVENGFTIFDEDARVRRWADAARDVAAGLDLKPDRCGQTWHVGVDALPNATDGAINGVPFAGPWDVETTQLHRAQLSVIYPDYPRQDAGETDASFRFRVKRCAAHMDGLLPEGPNKRRHLREPHAYILGVPLVDVSDSPLVVWRGSHRIMRAAFADVFCGIAPKDWGGVDVTEVYQDARRTVFETCEMEKVTVRLGQSVLLHRHLIHGVAPWNSGRTEPRMVAYFRPQLADIGRWL